MEIINFNMDYIQEVQTLLGDCTPYVLPHHPYVYWIMNIYYPSLCYVARENNKAAGFVCALHSVEKDCIFIWQLAVGNSHRRKGVAEMLCDEIIKYANKHKISSVQTTINDNNTASVKFFTKFANKYGNEFEKIQLPGLNNFENESAYIIKLHD